MRQTEHNTGMRRFSALDGLRGLAAAAVVLVHVWMFDRGASGRPPKDSFDHLLGEMRLGLPLFFVLSGFLIYRPFVAAAMGERKMPALGSYMARRAGRILPGYLLVLAGALVLLWATGRPWVEELQRLPAFLTFAQNQVPDARHFNPPLWSIAIEAAFYLAVPVIGVLALRTGPRLWKQAALVGVLALIGLGLGVVAAVDAWPVTGTRTLPVQFPMFAAGMMVAVLAGRGEKWGQTPFFTLVAVGGSLVVLDGAWHALQLGERLPRAALGDTPAAIGFALILYVLVCREGVGAWLASRPLALLGTVSYGIYLWHFPVIRLLRAEERMPESLPLAFAATMAVTLLFATASWLLVERPVLRWVHATKSLTWRHKLRYSLLPWTSSAPQTSASPASATGPSSRGT